MHEALTPDEVATELRVSPSTIYRLIRQRRLAAIRVGRTYRLDRSDVDTYRRFNNTRDEVRREAFAHVLAIADRQPELSSNDVLDELEALDTQHRATRTR